MNKPNHIVFTTIYYPKLLWEYRDNLEKYGHLDSTCVWVVGDLKTPAEVPDLCRQVTEAGLEVTYIDVEMQNNWGKDFPDFYNRLPFNNETRRNIGFLYALQQGCERLISIDDDNWPTEDDFIGGHSLTGKNWTQELIEEEKGFHNVCEYLKFEPSRPIFPRGYPFKLRGTKNSPTKVQAESSTIIGVTAGLWLREPDIDATTWLNGSVNSWDYTGPEYFVLNQNTWSPINTQNTSVARELIPAYLCIPMGWDVPGGKIQRYGDIWGGYFLESVLQGTPYHVAFGRPLVDHRRNPHNYVDDLRHEFWGTILTDWLLNLLREDFKPSSTSICDRVIELSIYLKEKALIQMPGWSPPEMKEFISHTADTMKIWSQVCSEVISQ